MLCLRQVSRLACCGAAAVSSIQASAQLPAGADEVIVTASRSAETASEALAAISVITRQDIERLQPRDLQDLLVGLPGVLVASNGGPGKSSSLFLRGTESDHTLVLIDGVKIGSATSGAAALEQLPVDQIERIEIVRGPRSSLYGSEAIGGVIQIFTHRGVPGEATRFSGAIGGGNLGSAEAEASLRGGVGGSGWYGIGLTGRRTDGVDVRPGLSADSGRDADDDGYRSASASLRGGWRFSNGAQWSVHGLRAEGTNEFDGASQDESELLQQVLGTTLHFAPLRRWRVGLAAGQSRDESDNFLDGAFVSRFETTRRHYSWQNDIELGQAQLLVAGVDHLRDEVDGTTDYAVTSREDTGSFVQYQGAFGDIELQASGRYDDNEQFGDYETGSAALGWRAGPLRLRAAYGTAFKAPTFNELYFPGFGNPDARPEKARSAEIGIALRHARCSWEVSAFRTEVDDLLVYNAQTQSSMNLDEALIRGVEAQAAAVLRSWSLRGSATWLDPENRAQGANRGRQLPRRAQQSGRLEVDRRIGRLSLGATLFASGERYDNASNSLRMGGYATLALRAEYKLAPRWLLQAEGSNVLDRHYETAASYAQPGSSFFVTLRYLSAQP